MQNRANMTQKLLPADGEDSKVVGRTWGPPVCLCSEAPYRQLFLSGVSVLVTSFVTEDRSPSYQKPSQLVNATSETEAYSSCSPWERREASQLSPHFRNVAKMEQGMRHRLYNHT